MKQSLKITIVPVITEIISKNRNSFSYNRNFLSRSSAISLIYGRFESSYGDISLIYGSLGRKNDPTYTPELAFSQVDLPYISEMVQVGRQNLPYIGQIWADCRQGEADRVWRTVRDRLV